MRYYELDFAIIDELVGKEITRVEVGDNDGEDEIRFFTRDAVYIMYHEQDCCESVYIKEIDNELQKLVGATVVKAEESCNSGEGDDGTFLWTFYKLASSRGDYFAISWYGTSNGYYSESVSIRKQPLE